MEREGTFLLLHQPLAFLHRRVVQLEAHEEDVLAIVEGAQQGQSRHTVGRTEQAVQAVDDDAAVTVIELVRTDRHRDTSVVSSSW